MDIAEARKVIWLKNNPRPLGELVDEGYLTRDKLLWAAERAYNPKLQEAAKMLLKVMSSADAESAQQPISTAFEIGMTLEKARSTPWPFAPFKGQLMGTLLETGQVSLKDLGYAIDKAYNANVRQAAIALSLSRMEQAVKEPVHVGPVEVVSGGRSYSARKESQIILLEGAILGFLLGAMLVLTIVSWPNLFHQNSAGKSFIEAVSSPAGMIALAILVVFTILALWLPGLILDRIMNKLDKQIDQHRLGKDGEDQTVQMIIQALDASWSVFRNVILPGSKGDLDIVLVGPPGVWVLEVKNFRGTYRNIGERWELKQGKTWKPASVNPSRQAQNNATRLGNFLRADHINQFVEPAVVWANQESSLTVENPSTVIWQYDHILDELGNIWQVDKLSVEERKKINDKLSKLCEAQKERNNHEHLDGNQAS